MPASQSDTKIDNLHFNRWNTAGLDISIFIRSWYLILVCCAVGGAAVYLASSSQTPLYTATTTLFVRSGESGVSSSLGEIQASREISRTFKELIKTNAVLEQVRDELGLPYSVNGLKGSLAINVVAGTQLLSVSATDSSPELAADIADTVAQVFIVQREEAGLTEIARLQATLEQYGIFDSADLLAAQINSLGGLQIAQPADVPASPTSPRPVRDGLLGVIVGIGLSLVLVILLDRLDVRVKSDIELATITGSYNIGSVPVMESADLSRTFETDANSEGFVSNEAFMFIAAKILDHQHQNTFVKDYLVTSLDENEGKTTLSAQVAAALASANRQVILADLDLRKPDVGNVLGIDSEIGLTTVLNGHANLQDCLIDTAIPNLKVLVSGPVPPDPTAVFSNASMATLMEELRSMADVIIYDSAPLKPVPDSWMLLHDVHACILAVNQSTSSRHELQAVTTRVKGASVRSLCTVLNRTRANGGSSIYGYGYGHKYGRLKSSYGSKQDREGWRVVLKIADYAKSLQNRIKTRS